MKKGEDSTYTQSIEVLLRETVRKDYADLLERQQSWIALQDYDVRQNEFWIDKRDIWTRPAILSWHFSEHQKQSQEWSPDEVRSRSDGQSTDEDRSSAEKHHNVVTTLFGNEVIYTDFWNKGIHGDESNISLSRTNTLVIINICFWKVIYEIWIPSVVCVTSMTFCLEHLNFFVWCFWPKTTVLCTLSKTDQCARSDERMFLRRSLYSFIILIGVVNIDFGLKRITHFLLGSWLYVVSFLVTNELQVVHADYISTLKVLVSFFSAEHCNGEGSFLLHDLKISLLHHFPREIMSGDV